MPCALRGYGPSCMGRSGAHHVKTVGSGGMDKDNLIPVCMVHHSILHGGRYNYTARDFCKQHGLDLKQIAAEYTKRAEGISDMDLDY